MKKYEVINVAASSHEDLVENIEPEFVQRCNEMFKEEGDALYEKRRQTISKWN